MATEPVKHKRGIFLSSIILLMAVINLGAGLYFLLGSSAVREAFPVLPPVAIIFYGLICLANVGWAAALWKMRKLGLYGFAGSVIAAYIFNIAMTGSYKSILGFFGLAVLIIIVLPVWKYMT